MTTRILRHMVLTSAVALLATPALAQEQVTVVKRDGGKVSGRFEDWAHNTDLIYVRVSQSDQQRIPMNNVLVIDVGGNGSNLPASETEAAQSGDHVLVTKGGETLKGRLVNIEGGEGSAKENEPRTVTFRAGSERRFPMADVRRIYLGNYPKSSGSSSSSQPSDVPADAIRVAANQQWTDTNVVVRRGDRIAFNGKGEIQLSSDGNDKASVAGSLQGRKAPNAPAPQLPAGALIGRIGNGPPFGIGNQTNPLPMSGEGRLSLGINDDNVGDNSGEFVVTLRLTRGR